MVKKASHRYRVWLEPEVHAQRTKLPGSVRQRVKRQIDKLAKEPRPSISRLLDASGINLPSEIEIRRIRLENWRILYAVNDNQGWVWILAIHRRPPYGYEDLPELISRLSD